MLFATVALLAFPDKVAVIVPAMKLPLASLFTIVFVILEDVGIPKVVLMLAMLVFAVDNVPLKLVTLVFVFANVVLNDPI